jgi:hypothetical protein
MSITSTATVATVFLASTLSSPTISEDFSNRLKQDSNYYTSVKKTATTYSDLLVKSEYNDFKKLEGELYSYLELDENWDGYGGTIPDKELINSCQEIIEKLKKLGLNAPKPMLTGSGEVGLYWKDDTTYIELSFEEEDTFSYIIDNGKNIVGEEDCSKDDNLPSRLHIALEKKKKEKPRITNNTNSLSSMYRS